MTEGVLKTGTTTIGIRCKDCVIMASDRRATMANQIAHSHVQKIYKIADNIGMTIAGLVGDAQLMVRYMQSEIALYEMKKGGSITANAAATLASDIIRQGFYLGLIIGGYDKTGGHVYSIDGAGGYIEDNVISTGSGSVYALGALEAGYKPNMTFEEGRDLVITALNSAISRDNASGGGMLVSVIDKDGMRFLSDEETRTRVTELGFRYPY
ncbi:MAG: proteasome subunit beta [archaeon]|nr:proteasome subunit beta [archaeon]